MGVQIQFYKNGGVRQKVTSIWLKISKQIANGWAIIATKGFRQRPNSYGFKGIKLIFMVPRP